MKLKKAAQGTMNLMTEVEYGFADACDKEHIDWMLNQIILGTITGTKAHRWLGWAQAVVCFNEDVTLEELKKINYEA